MGTIGELRAEIARLQKIEDALEEALGDFDHELRRVSDGLVRAGGRSSELDRRAAQLRKNLALSQKDLESNRAQLRALRGRLKSLEDAAGTRDDF